jgi:hypothetical protein
MSDFFREISNFNLATVSAALLTPTLAVVAAYVAYQQYRINKSRFAQELYEKRLRVYKSLRCFLKDLACNVDVSFEDIAEFYSDIAEVDFLFGKDVQSYLEKIYQKAMKRKALYDILHSKRAAPVGEDESKFSEEEFQILEWLVAQSEESKKIFKKYLKVR